MPGFRIYFMDGGSNHIIGSHDFTAEDDLDAIRKAEEHRSGKPMELWSGERKINRWDDEAGPGAA